MKKNIYLPKKEQNVLKVIVIKLSNKNSTSKFIVAHNIIYNDVFLELAYIDIVIDTYIDIDTESELKVVVTFITEDHKFLTKVLPVDILEFESRNVCLKYGNKNELFIGEGKSSIPPAFCRYFRYCIGSVTGKLEDKVFPKVELKILT